MCDATAKSAVFTDTHFHVCPKCLHIWSHTTAEAVMAGSRKAHRCPACSDAQGGMGWHSLVAAVTERGKLRAALAAGSATAQRPRERNGDERA